MKKCPSCMAVVQDEASECPHCGEDLSGARVRSNTPKKTVMGIRGLTANPSGPPQTEDEEPARQRNTRSTMFGLPAAEKPEPQQSEEPRARGTRSTQFGLPALENDQEPTQSVGLGQESSEDEGDATMVAPAALFARPEESAPQPPPKRRSSSVPKHGTLMGMSLADIEAMGQEESQPEQDDSRRTMFSLPSPFNDATPVPSERPILEEEQGDATSVLNASTLESLSSETSSQQAPSREPQGRPSRSTMFGIPGLKGPGSQEGAISEQPSQLSEVSEEDGAETMVLHAGVIDKHAQKQKREQQNAAPMAQVFKRSNTAPNLRSTQQAPVPKVDDQRPTADDDNPPPEIRKKGVGHGTVASPISNLFDNDEEDSTKALQNDKIQGLIDRSSGSFDSLRIDHRDQPPSGDPTQGIERSALMERVAAMRGNSSVSEISEGEEDSGDSTALMFVDPESGIPSYVDNHSAESPSDDSTRNMDSGVLDEISGDAGWLDLEDNFDPSQLSEFGDDFDSFDDLDFSADPIRDAAASNPNIRLPDGPFAPTSAQEDLSEHDLSEVDAFEDTVAVTQDQIKVGILERQDEPEETPSGESRAPQDSQSSLPRLERPPEANSNISTEFEIPVTHDNIPTNLPEHLKTSSDAPDVPAVADEPQLDNTNPVAGPDDPSAAQIETADDLRIKQPGANQTPRIGEKVTAKPETEETPTLDSTPDPLLPTPEETSPQPPPEILPRPADSNTAQRPKPTNPPASAAQNPLVDKLQAGFGLLTAVSLLGGSGAGFLNKAPDAGLLGIVVPTLAALFALMAVALSLAKGARSLRMPGFIVIGLISFALLAIVILQIGFQPAFATLVVAGLLALGAACFPLLVKN